MWKTFREIETDNIRTFNLLKNDYNNYINIDKIHPLKQKKCVAMVEQVSRGDFSKLKKIWIFGSSTNNCCNIYSDVDVLIEFDDYNESVDEGLMCLIHKVFVKTLGTDYDVVVLNELDENKQIYNNIIKTRRLIYERDD